jgi:D-alanyl-D-alanine carboxypeptidase/D-alanyl-D-alanine-endopeptidase (penicillin-binding protein 4)
MMIKRYSGYVILFTACSWLACSPGRSVHSSASSGTSSSGTAPSGTTSSGSGSGSARTAKGSLQQFVQDTLLQQPGLISAQLGISIYDPATGLYDYNYQGDKYFIPASNTKLFSLYAGLSYLGDSLVGMRYRITDTALFVIPSGDPTFLHPSYSSQPVIDLIRKAGKNVWLADDNWQDQGLGRGWAWDDYNDDYSAERSPLPIYGNTIRWVQQRQKGNANDPFGGSPSIYSIPEVDWAVKFTTDTTKKNFFVRRYRDANVFEVTEGKEDQKEQYTPFITDGLSSAALLLKDTAGRPIGVKHLRLSPIPNLQHPAGWNILHSQPVDSLFRPMMVNSDNFFAEQTLLMVGNEVLGSMNDTSVIGFLLRGDLDSLPQKPNWVDGSGLSRNDLFSPQDLVWLLDKMQKKFGLARMKRILPTGGTGTLGSYYRQDSSFIYAKTGSLSGVVALSGYLITKKGNLRIFSVLINNYTGSGAVVRRQIEKLIHRIRDTY